MLLGYWHAVLKQFAPPSLPPAARSGNDVQLEYKYVVRSERDKSAVRWKEGNNCYLTLPAQGRLHVRDTWDDSMREVEVSCSAAARGMYC